jgi:uncharacterized protein YbaR (Trm112 family)
MKQQHVDSLICPLCLAQALEEGVGGDLVYLQSNSEEAAEEGKP